MGICCPKQLPPANKGNSSQAGAELIEVTPQQKSKQTSRRSRASREEKSRGSSLRKLPSQLLSKDVITLDPNVPHPIVSASSSTLSPNELVDQRNIIVPGNSTSKAIALDSASSATGQTMAVTPTLQSPSPPPQEHHLLIHSSSYPVPVSSSSAIPQHENSQNPHIHPPPSTQNSGRSLVEDRTTSSGASNKQYITSPEEEEMKGPPQFSRTASPVSESDNASATGSTAMTDDEEVVKRRRALRNVTRKSIQKDIEDKQKRGENFWQNLLTEANREGPVLLSHAAHEDEDSKHEIAQVNQYNFVKALGEGSSGEVKLALNEKDGKLYAIKVLNRSAENRRVSLSRKGNTRLSFFNGLPQEVAILQRLNHPNMVNLFEVINDPKMDRIYLAFEYIPGGSVFPSSIEMIPIPESQARSYFRDMLDGVEYLHSQGVCHGDIKPENLLVTPDGHIKICDFGVSYMITDNISKKRAGMGTPLFTAPEVVSSQKIRVQAEQLDIWALGITLYVFASGKCPFIGQSLIETFQLIKNEPLVIPSGISENLKDLLAKMLEKQPDKRITIPEIKKHPWILEI